MILLFSFQGSICFLFFERTIISYHLSFSLSIIFSDFSKDFLFSSKKLDIKESNHFKSLDSFNWLRPTFPGPFGPSIIGDLELNFCVRNGNRWIL